MKITFFGAARQITGTCFLVEAAGRRMLVDCGLFQGTEDMRRKNYDPLPFDPKSIDYLFVSHAHADHIGRVPQLVKEGFSGKIFATFPTKEFFRVMLEEASFHLAEEAKMVGTSPLWEKEDVQKAEEIIIPVDYREKVWLDENCAVRFSDAGHILGSAIIEVFVKEGGKEKKAVFSGDLGNDFSPLLPPPAAVYDADVVVVESTYGGRFHEEPHKRREALEDVVESVARSEGVLLIPAFSLERVHMILFELHSLMHNKKVPSMPVFMDSPLALRLLPVYEKFSSFLRPDAQSQFGTKEAMFRFPEVTFTESVEDSKSIFAVRPPKIIIAASGMSTGGRILFHEKAYLPQPSTTLLFVNYQAEGTLGAELLHGAREIEIFGEKVSVEAHIRTIFGYSAHADQIQLETWLRHFQKPIQKICVVHGEERQAHALAVWAQDNLGVATCVPGIGDSVEI